MLLQHAAVLPAGSLTCGQLAKQMEQTLVAAVVCV
jgi:hypothetical protein